MESSARIPASSRSDVGEQPRQLRDLLHPDARAHAALRSQKRAQSPLDPQPFSFERERVGIAVRQRVLDDGTRRLLRISGRIEKRPNLGPHSGEAAIHSPLIIRRSRLDDMGPRAYFRHGTGLCLAVVLFLLVSVSPARSRRRDALQPTRPCTCRTERRLGEDGSAGGRSPHRPRRLLPQSRARTHSGVESEAARRLRGTRPARAGVPVPHGGRRHRHARGRRLARQPVAAGVRRPDPRAGRSRRPRRGRCLLRVSAGSTGP